MTKDIEAEIEIIVRHEEPGVFVVRPVFVVDNNAIIPLGVASSAPAPGGFRIEYATKRAHDGAHNIRFAVEFVGRSMGKIVTVEVRANGKKLEEDQLVVSGGEDILSVRGRWV